MSRNPIMVRLEDGQLGRVDRVAKRIQHEQLSNQGVQLKRAKITRSDVLRTCIEIGLAKIEERIDPKEEAKRATRKKD